MGDARNIWTYGVPICILLSLLAWVKNLASFTFTFKTAIYLMFSTMFVVWGYSIVKIQKDGISSDILPINYSGMWTTMGFSIYTYEGVGIVMPVMKTCDCPEKFEKLLIAACLTLAVSYCIFGTLTYLAYGEMKQQLALQWLPQDAIVKLTTVCFIVNLIFTYPLTINPTNVNLDSYTVDIFMRKSSTKKTCLKNLVRVIVCVSAAYLGIEMKEFIDKAIGFAGAMFCAPLAMIVPTLCHLILVAETPS